MENWHIKTLHFQGIIDGLSFIVCLHWLTDPLVNLDSKTLAKESVKCFSAGSNNLQVTKFEVKDAMAYKIKACQEK